ncbi:hypothetical protein [Synechococcus sp. KORDI-100]|uniref:hypothetical protein n=1 Tax=Synechococcus sp. KORDI-100 TaxID=1280380 RepID=UPI000AF93DFF|nr:hypothetical protein [Synechococcus sp. KORDI-100]
MPTRGERSHAGNGWIRLWADPNQRRALIRRSLALLLAGLGAAPGSPAAAGLLRPVLDMIRPRLEERLKDECLKLVSSEVSALQNLVNDSCQSMARPACVCLIEETSHSGRELGVVTELISGRIGDDAEVVIKRCLGKMLGLPATSLENLSLPEVRPSGH